MTSYETIQREYNKRYRNYNTPDYVSLVSKAYSRFKRGVEIRWKDIQQNIKYRSKMTPLSNMLIELEQIKNVKEKVEQKFEEVDKSEEMDLQVIYGEYGHGKSQVAQILEEHYSNRDRYPQLIHLYHCISTFSDFLDIFILTIKDHFKGTESYSKFESLFKKIKASLKSKELPLLKVVKTLINLIQEVTLRGKNILLIFDEIDTLLMTSIEELKPWIYFFVRLNDADNLKIILVLLLPRGVSEQLKTADTRLQRWNPAFGIDSIRLNGKYQDKVPHALANVLAMKSVISKIKFNKFYLGFVTDIIDHQIDRFKKDTIRSINTWSVELSELLSRLMKLNLESLSLDFNQLDKIDRGKRLEKTLKMFLVDSQLGDFKLRNLDTSEVDTYQIIYNEKNLRYNDYLSDGHFQINKIVSGFPVKEHEVAVEIKYTSIGHHTEGELKKVKTLALGFPTIFFSLGSSESHYKSLLNEIKLWKKQYPNCYPLYVIRIPHNLLIPLLILRSQEDPTHYNKIDILMFWAEKCCPFFPNLIDFFKTLRSELLERQLAIREEAIKASMTESDQEFVSSPLSEGINTLCSYIHDVIKTSKTIRVLKNDIQKRIKKKVPEIEDEFLTFLPQMLNELIQQNMLEETKWRNDDAIKKKGLKWNLDKSVEILYSKYIKT